MLLDQITGRLVRDGPRTFDYTQVDERAASDERTSQSMGPKRSWLW